MKFLGLNKLSKEKRKELILVALVTAIVLSGLGFGLIKYQYSVLARLETKQMGVNKQLEQMDALVRRSALTQAELAVNSEKLFKLEENMASRDIYSWMVTMLRRFKQSYRIDIPQVGQPELGDMNLLPKFPYKQASLSVSGTARYHDLGKFLADFENEFPHVRILNLDIIPASIAGEQGLLSFRFQIVALVNPNPR